MTSALMNRAYWQGEIMPKNAMLSQQSFVTNEEISITVVIKQNKIIWAYCFYQITFCIFQNDCLIQEN